MKPSTMYHIQSPWTTRPKTLLPSKVQQLDYWLMLFAVSHAFLFQKFEDGLGALFFMGHRIYAIMMYYFVWHIWHCKNFIPCKFKMALPRCLVFVFISFL
ncbi:hypothetical protein EYC84_007649 [Monilinia fructicola]|uniref:Uncharacterized protein n=1 Tax=Monilinia fructicola TaxID=38448 RepID=A0A5M9JGG4_MONFR|nr:hypothetical protein EYC84_007649 [Monilinia fructicola]